MTIPAHQTIECGYLIVPENRAKPDGPTTHLAVIILKSPAQNPESDPLVFLNGGPGGQALTDLPRFLGIFRLLLLNLNRDVIIFSQRGADLSQPALECPEVTSTFLARAKGQTLSIAEEQAPLLACRDRWLADGVDLVAYTTAASAADVNDLWRTLGYAEVNLFGVSYGTVLAQTVMRDYPDGIRSVVLDSAFPLEIQLQTPDTAAANAATYFKSVFEICADNFLCRTLYPDVEQKFYDLIAQIDAQPMLLTMPDPVTGESFTFPFDSVTLIEIAQQVPPRVLPALIYDLIEGDYTTIIEAKEQTIKNLSRYGPPPGRAMAYSIFCSQGLYAPHPATEAINAYPERVWAEHTIRVRMPLPCEQWPTNGPPDDRPAISDIPTLVLLGEFDSTLSVEYGQHFRQNLSHSYILNVPETSHSVLQSSGPCANNLVRTFINAPEKLSPSDCLYEAEHLLFDTKFVIRAAVMRSPVQGLLILLSLGLIGATSLSMRRWKRTTFPLGLAWQRSLRLIGWQLITVSVGLLALGWLTNTLGWLAVKPTYLVALVLPILTALPAAFTFSPEDEPALEVLLATPRPLSILLLERLAALFLWQGGIGTLFSLFIVSLEGNLLTAILGWLSPLICLSGLAVYITLTTRRAIYSVALVTLLWLVAAVFGDFIVLRWPFTWPLHLYLPASHQDYILNRLFLIVVGLALIGLMTPRLLNNTERLLLNSRASKRKTTKKDTAYIPDTISISLPSQSLASPTRWQLWLAQTGAIIRYEILMQWRRIALPALAVGVLVPAILGAFLSQTKFSGYQMALATGTLSLGAVRANITAEMIMITWLGAFLVVILLLPLVVADTIPKDQHWRMREILDSLPLKPNSYLTGKVLSLWLSLTISLSTAAMLIAGVWRILVGPFNLGIYLELWLVGILPMALTNAALVSLLAAWQPTNRRAIMLGGGFSLFCLTGLVFAFVTYGTFWDWLNPARPAIVLYYLIGWPGAMQGSDIFSQFNQSALDVITQVVNRTRVWQSILGGLGQVGLVWWLVWWSRR